MSSLGVILLTADVPPIPSEVIPIYQWIVGVLGSACVGLVYAVVYLYRKNIKTNQELSTSILAQAKAQQNVVHAIELQNKDISFIKECCEKKMGVK